MICRMKIMAWIEEQSCSHLNVWYSERLARPKALIGPQFVGLFQVLDRDVESGRGREWYETFHLVVVCGNLRAMPAKVSPSSTMYLGQRVHHTWYWKFPKLKQSNANYMNDSLNMLTSPIWLLHSLSKACPVAGPTTTCAIAALGSPISQ